MRLAPDKQAETGAFDQTAEPELLTVEYWHKRFKLALGRFDSFTTMADALADADETYKGAAGVLLLERLRAGRTKKPLLMYHAVQLMEKLRPEKTPLSAVLKRQKLVAPDR